jgi:hypothetical protein
VAQEDDWAPQCAGKLAICAELLDEGLCHPLDGLGSVVGKEGSG